jgi:hypothetical protein
VKSPENADFRALIARLADHKVELIVVGGTAAILHGAALTTLDVDVVYRQTPENVARLMASLAGLEAEVRPIIPGRRIEPTQAILERATGPLLLATGLGPLDLLPRLDPLGQFEALIELSAMMTVAGHEIRVIGVDALIASKQHANRPKDRLALPVLLSLKKDLDE